jgi:hypothetical protein
VIIIVFCFFGYKRRLHQLKSLSEQDVDISTISAAVLGLLALMLSFTFNIAFTRFEARRQIIILESNEIGTAILRTKLYPDSVGRLMRAEFKKYIDARIAYYEAGNNPIRLAEARSESTKHSDSIWKIVALQTQEPASLVRSNQMIPAMNDLIDIVTTRDKLRAAYIPDIMLLVLFFLIAICSFLIGFTTKAKQTLPTIAVGFALIISITVFLILDLVHSYVGFITQDSAEETIVALKSMITD